MRVTVRLFAELRVRFGRDPVCLVLHDGATIADAIKEIEGSVDGLAPLLSKSTVAVDQEYASRDRVLHDGAEVAILPPVSGG
jgi:molybdopterin converting factor small subunit